MKKVFFIGIFLMMVFSSFGQNNGDSIEIKKVFGTVFRQNGNNLTPKQLLDITQTNAEAFEEMKIAKSNYDVGFIFGFAGGLFIGWPAGTAIAGGEPNWTLAGIGTGLILISIPSSAAYTKHAKIAVRIYNNGLKTSGVNNLDLKIGLAYNGVGLKMVF